ncbi:MAG: hypothetical protein HQL03_10360 [Nitrospirae bacterium]|nr:hypothetical protein [Nitrospirota bacterium]MBF0591510.1 hypothetical protein [Nitrospirota bacterium]
MGDLRECYDFKKAFEEHYILYLDNESKNDSLKMVLFYAVECGLKAAIIRERGDTIDVLDEMKRIGHKLNMLVQKLKIAENYRFPENIYDNKNHPIVHHKVHEAWRYGRDIAEKDNQTFEDKLNKLASFLSEKLKSKSMKG